MDTITRRWAMQTPAMAFEQPCSWRLRCPFSTERRTQELQRSSEMGGCVAEDGKIALEEGMATHSSILAWKIPWTEEPGGLQSTGSQRVRHDSVTKRAHTVTALADQGRPAGSAAAEGFQAQLSRLPDAVLGGSLGGSPAQTRLHQNPCDRQRRCSVTV